MMLMPRIWLTHENWKLYYKLQWVHITTSSLMWSWAAEENGMAMAFYLFFTFFLKVAQSHLTLCDPMEFSPWILKAIIPEWAAFPFSRRSSQPRDWTQVSHNAGGFFTSRATREAKQWPSKTNVDFPPRTPFREKKTKHCKMGTYQQAVASILELGLKWQ